MRGTDTVSTSAPAGQYSQRRIAPGNAEARQRETFVRNCWYVAAWVHEFSDTELNARTIAGEPIVFFRKFDGQLVALEDRCRHRFAPLSRGCKEGDAVRCMYHGMKYDAEGRCIEIPGQDAIPQIARVRAYPVIERHSWVWIWMGEPALADAALIPPAVSLEGDGWVMGCGKIDYSASYRLINANLLDFSHLSFVHRQSFGSNPVFALTRPKVAAIERGVRIQRWLPGIASSETPTVQAQGARGVFDQWQAYDFLVPGVLILRSEVWPAGSADASPEAAPPGAPISTNISCQAVTPIDEQHTRYFFSAGTRETAGAAETRDRLMSINRAAFAEDKAMIEAQQKIIDADPARKVMPTTVDRAVLLFERLMAQLT